LKRKNRKKRQKRQKRKKRKKRKKRFHFFVKKYSNSPPKIPIFHGVIAKFFVVYVRGVD
jgi:hypothetical protein